MNCSEYNLHILLLTRSSLFSIVNSLFSPKKPGDSPWLPNKLWDKSVETIRWRYLTDFKSLIIRQIAPSTGLTDYETLVCLLFLQVFCVFGSSLTLSNFDDIFQPVVVLINKRLPCVHFIDVFLFLSDYWSSFKTTMINLTWQDTFNVTMTFLFIGYCFMVLYLYIYFIYKFIQRLRYGKIRWVYF